MKFLYVFSFLRYYISDRIEYYQVMKTAIEYENKKQYKWVIFFNWSSEQEKTFKTVKQAVCKIILTEENLNFQYHLAIDVSETGIESILF